MRTGEDMGRVSMVMFDLSGTTVHDDTGVRDCLYEAAREASLCEEDEQRAGWLRAEAIRRARVKRVAAAMSLRVASAGETAEDAKTGDVGTDGGPHGAEKKDQQST